MLDLHNANNLDILKALPDNSVDSIVTDPPYGISFMGKKWDYDVPSVETWKECIRVLKPGGHILVACGTRTQHRMAVNIEDAGFEIRDIVAWIYGSGFPKSLNIGKAVDKLQGNEREVVGTEKIDIGMQSGSMHSGRSTNVIERDKTVGNSPYEGWGTALKPAMELWTLARKPLSEKNIAENVLKWGTGGINIDGSRVEATKEDMGDWDRFKGHQNSNTIRKNMVDNKTEDFEDRVDNGVNTLGRFPANLIHDNSDEVTDLFPNDSQRFFYCAKASKSERNNGLDGFEDRYLDIGDERPSGGSWERRTGQKPSLTKNHHPTVKPVALMRYLVKMITPKGGMVLDPFMGSGSTGVACMKENFNFIGIELDEEYFKIAQTRINNQLE